MLLLAHPCDNFSNLDHGQIRITSTGYGDHVIICFPLDPERFDM
jgi:hypothetical protein